jgi:nucleotide-binding universal stress UspA family protein
MEYLAHHGATVRAQGVLTEVLQTQGDVALGIVDLAEEHHANLILLVTHAREGLSRVVHGSVADRVLHGATVPVLLLKHGESSSRVFGPGQSPHLLVPLDGSALAESALPLASALARLVGAPMTLLRSLDLPDLSLTGRGRAGAATAAIRASIPAERQEAEQYLASIGQRLQAQGLATTNLVTEGGAAQDIATQARTLEAAGQAVLIVMATHGHSGLGRWLYGSVAGAVLHLADVPLLVIRSHGA